MKSSKRTTTQSQKLKFLCSFNGFFVALHPNSDKFRYQGGDTHLICVDRHHCFNLSCLLSILSLHRSSPISLKYKLPECSTLHPISNDEDFSKMVHAHDWLLSTGNISRLRMYIINNEMNHQRKSVHVGKVNKRVVGVNPNEMAHQKRGLFGCFKFGKIDREVVHSRTRNHRMNVCGSRAAAQNGGKNEFVSESRLLKKERVNGRNVARNGQYFQGNLLSMTVHKADGSLVDCYVNEDAGFVSRKNLVKNRLALGKGDVMKDGMQKLVSTIIDVSKEIDDANLNDRVKPTNISPKEVAENDPNLKTHNNDLACRELQIINHTDLEDIRTLGVGAYGTVHYGKWRGSDVAIKRLKSSSSGGLGEDRAVANFWKEARLLAQLNHPNVVAFYGVVVKDGPVTNMAAVTEFMTNGSLKQVLRKKDRTIDRRKRLIIAMDVAFGMEYLHEKNIVHFDLKSHNLLVNMKDPSRPICKIGDFGLSKVKETTSVPGGVRGSVPWMAPELLTTKKNMVTEKVDVYSFGIVMWELLTGEEPYEDMRSDKIIAGVIEGCQRPDIPSWCDPSWRSLMEKCWSSNPSSRPSFSKIAKELRSIAASLNIK